MKSQQRIERERVFGPTPEIVKRRLRHTLHHVEEEPPMKKRSIPILVFVLLLVLAGIAYAAVTGGLRSYYENRFNYGDRLPEDVEQRIQTDIPQSGDGNPLAQVTVTDAAWLGKGLDINAPDSETLDIHINATVKDPDTYEMVDGPSIDVDAARGEDERREHPEYGDRADEAWLWAYGTHGPLDQVMKDPGKQLLLFGRVADGDLWLEGDEETPLPIASYDLFVDAETGAVAVNYTLQFTDGELAALRTHADADGYVKLVYQSWAAPFTDGAQASEGEVGTTTFSIHLP